VISARKIITAASFKPISGYSLPVGVGATPNIAEIRAAKNIATNREPIAIAVSIPRVPARPASS
jgi:hypothetical protein